ncbi:MAG: DUF4340 domain-containing protein [Planctomycetaceae bacterium]
MSRNQRNETLRTAIFLGLALVFAGGAYGVHRMMRPTAVAGFEMLGKPFFESFDDPLAVAELRVAAFDDARGKQNVFTVEREGDLWRIPSRFGYPAEAKERVASTAVSLMGIKRETLESQRDADHQRLGVVDPLAPAAGATHGFGTRVSLLDDEGKTLADYIIGKAAGERGDQRYVRRPDEKATYRAAVSLKLSTKFAEWIEPELLKLNSHDVTKLELNVPRWETQQRVTARGVEVREALVGEDVTRVERAADGGDWRLEGINEETEQVDERKVDDAIRAIADLEIIDVRPKPKGLRADLSLDPSLELDPDDAVYDLRTKGFFLGSNRDGSEQFLISRAGELIAAAKSGAVYHLHIGESAQAEAAIDVETGDAADAADADPQRTDSATDTDVSSEGGAGDEAKSAATGRYLFVRVEFDPAALGEKPVAPLKPEKPELLETAAPAVDEESEPEPESDPASAPASETDAKPQADEKPDLDELRSKHESDLRQYESDLRAHEFALEQYDEKVEKGRREVAALNQRFGDWYYVTSDKSLDKLRFTKQDLVQPKPRDDEGGADAAKSPTSPLGPLRPLEFPETPRRTEPPSPPVLPEVAAPEEGDADEPADGG